MPKKDLYSPKRQLRLFEQNGKTILIGEDSKPVATALTKQLKAEAISFLSSHLFGMMAETMRADAVEIGIEKATLPEHMLFAKAVWRVTGLMEGIVKELSELKIDEIAGPSNRV